MNYLLPKRGLPFALRARASSSPSPVSGASRDLAPPVEVGIHSAAGQPTLDYELKWEEVDAPGRTSDIDRLALTIRLKSAHFTTDQDFLYVRFFAPLPEIDYDFGVIASAALAFSRVEMIRGGEFLIRSATEGASAGMPVTSVAMAVVGHRFQRRPDELFGELRIWLRNLDLTEPLEIRLEKLFLGQEYDPYFQNAHYEMLKYRGGGHVDLGRVSETSAYFMDLIKDQKGDDAFIGSQAFIRPFAVRKVGDLSFPFLVGTNNSLYWYGLDPRHQMELFVEEGYIKRNDRVLDCGAHAGLVGMFCAHVAGPSGRVTCFDPFFQNNAQIRANAMISGLDNVVVADAGVGDRTTSMTVSNVGQQMKAAAKEGPETSTVRQVRLDDYIDERPTFLKIDIEGFEVAALRGAQRLLTECRPRIFLEGHTPMIADLGDNLADIFTLIPPSLYNVQVFLERPGETWRDYEPGLEQQFGQSFNLRAFPK